MSIRKILIGEDGDLPEYQIGILAKGGDISEIPDKVLFEQWYTDEDTGIDKIGIFKRDVNIESGKIFIGTDSQKFKNIAAERLRYCDDMTVHDKNHDIIEILLDTTSEASDKYKAKIGSGENDLPIRFKEVKSNG